MEKQGKLPRIRIAWRLKGPAGHGDWFEGGKLDRLLLESTVLECNSRYGPSTHWIEEEPRRKKPRIHKTLHGDYVCFCEADARSAPTPEAAYVAWKEAMRRYASPECWEAHFPDEPQ